MNILESGSMKNVLFFQPFFQIMTEHWLQVRKIDPSFHRLAGRGSQRPWFLYVLDYGDVIYRHAAPSNLLNLGLYQAALRFITGESYDIIIVSFVASLADLPRLRRNQHSFFFLQFLKKINNVVPQHIF